MHILYIVLLTVMLIDFLYSFKYMHDNQSHYDNWILHIPFKIANA